MIRCSHREMVGGGALRGVIDERCCHFLVLLGLGVGVLHIVMCSWCNGLVYTACILLVCEELLWVFPLEYGPFIVFQVLPFLQVRSAVPLYLPCKLTTSAGYFYRSGV